ncbi:CsoS2 family carboxysome shell protein [Marichromatium bheemlicum]|uniref:Carboxysome shell protein n=1 Tax=Marichromatium bheemlicum TaxID=365339 RepID=A0ABX1I6H3_9GAMM|nr:CsoS2 family carboxysome shell protein [Marichromatium bheemlicum]NKN32776.1 carboxysome shell protein [Marichromatium bheemlicum]
MAEPTRENSLNGRAAAIARRRAQAKGGKRATPEVSPAAPAVTPAAGAPRPPKGERGALPVGRREAMARRQRIAESGGRALPAPRVRTAPAETRSDGRMRRRAQHVTPASGDEASMGEEQNAHAPSTPPRRVARPTPSRRARARGASVTREARPTGRVLAMARRAAVAGRGKAGLEAIGGRSRDAAATTLMRRAGASSREIARRVREQRCEHGKGGESCPRPSGRLRRQGGARANDGPRGEVSETARGLAVSGTRLGRARHTTGDEAGACRTVTGTEYLGAELFQEFCGQRSEPPAPMPVASTPAGQRVTGVRVGRGERVTGDERGAGRSLTGTPYTEPGAEGAPPKVAHDTTLAQRPITGTLLGRGARTTGDEAGACRRITGDEYLGSGHFRQHCEQVPAPEGGAKVGVTPTWRGQRLSGTQVGSAARVTGDAAGRCETVTGSDYLGPLHYQQHCAPEALTAQAARRPESRPGGADLSGTQPGIAGPSTGQRRGRCQSITGTPYVGESALAAVCDTAVRAPTEDDAPVEFGDDFPQPLGGGHWQGMVFSRPEGAARATPRVTGASGGGSARITGPFGLSSGVVTGTEEFRARRPSGAEQPAPGLIPAPVATPEAAVRARVTGEGRDGGARITGDDWGRGEHVTGTEGSSASVRNPTRRGGVMGPFAGARALRGQRQSEQAPPLQVTGASGGSERGALVTVSGGARG